MLLLVSVLFFTDFLHSMDVSSSLENTDRAVRTLDGFAFNKIQLKYSKRAQQVFEKEHIYFYDPIAKGVVNFRYNGYLENYCLKIKRFDQFVDFTSIKGFCEKDLLYCNSLIELFKRVEKTEDAVLERKKIVYNFKLFLYKLQNTDDNEVKEKAYNIFLTFMKQHCADHEKILSRQQACAVLVNLLLTGWMSSVQLADDFVWDLKKSSPADIFIVPSVIFVSWTLLFGMFLFDNYKLDACIKIILELQSRARNSQDINEEVVSLVENDEEIAAE